MRNSRESIYNALLAYLQTVVGPQVQTFSRVYRPHTDYAAAQLPACILDERKEKVEVERLAVAPLYHLNVDLWLYLACPVFSQIPGEETVIPMTALNNLLDLLEGSPLSNPPSGGMPYLTLGGLVQHVWIEGDILKVAGIASSTMQYNLARVPIVIFTT